MAKRIMCIIISVLMIVSLLPTGAFADSGDDTGGIVEVTASSSGDADSGETTDEDSSSESDGEEVVEEFTVEGETVSVEAAAEEVAATDTVATIGENSYETLAAAVEAATSGQTVTLTSDVTLSEALNITTSLTLDLGTYTLSGRVNIKSGADVTIQNGTMTNSGGQALNVYASGSSSDPTTVTLANTASISTADYGLCVFPTDNSTGYGEGVVVTVNGNITATSGIFISGNIKSCTTNDVVTVNSTVTGGGSSSTAGEDNAGIAVNGYMNVVVNGTVSGATGIEVRAGSLTVNSGATVTATATSFDITKNSSGSTTVGAGIAVVQHTTNLAVSVTVNGGTISGVYAVYENDIEDDTSTSSISISLTGGTYTGTTASVAVTDSSEVTTSITGGTYLLKSTSDSSTSADTTALSALGVTLSDEGTVTTAQVAQIGSTTYSTLAEAFAAVKSGETITLLFDVTESGTYSANGLYQVSTDVTLDLNYHTLTVNTTRVFGVLNGGSLTVKNGTVKIADEATATGNQFNILRGECSFTAENVTFDGNNIAANFLHVAADGTATISLTNCNITNQSGGVVVYDNDGNSTVTLTGCNYATNPSGGALNTITNFKIVFNSNNPITSSSTNWEASNSLRYTYVVADGGSVEADLTLATTKGAASLTVEGGSVTGTITVAEGTSMTVSGGTVTGTITTSGTFKMSGGTITASGSASQAVLVKGGTVNISDGTINASSSRALVFDTDVTVSGTISGGTFIGNDIALLARSSDNNKVSVTGGTYTASKGIDLVASILAEGYGVFDTEGNAATVSGNYYSSSLEDNTVRVLKVAASVTSGGATTYYETFDEALTNANALTGVDSITVTLLDDVTYSDSSSTVTINTSIPFTLEMNGHSITFESTSSYVKIGTSCTDVTIQNSASDDSKIANTCSTKSSTYALYVYGSSMATNITVKNVELSSASFYAIYYYTSENTTLTLENCTVTCPSSTYAIYGQRGNITITSGSVDSVYAVLKTTSGNNTYSYAYTFGTDGGSASDLTVGTLYIKTAGDNLTIKSGTFNTVSGTINVVSTISDSAVFYDVSSCTLPAGYYWKASTGTETTTYTIAVLDETTAAAKIVTTGSEGSSTPVYYSSLGDATKAATSGQTVVLLKDYEGTTYVQTMYAGVTIDLNGHSITNTNSGSYGAVYAYAGSIEDSDNAVITIKNSGSSATITGVTNAVVGSTKSTLTAGVELVIDITNLTLSTGTGSGASSVALTYYCYMEYTDANKALITNGGFVATVINGSDRIYGQFPYAVNAADVSDSTVTVTLLNDYYGSTSIASASVNSSATTVKLDMNGKTWTTTTYGTSTSNPGKVINLSDNRSYEISNGKFVATGKYVCGVYIYNSSTCTANLTLTSVDITLSNETAYYFGMVTNGSTGNEHTVVLDKSTIDARYCDYGVYFPSAGSLTLENESKIIGKYTGIEIRSGDLTITDSTVETTDSSYFNTANNNSGSTVTGAAIAISQHTTNNAINVTITDSTISGYYGVYEINYNSGNTSEVNITISGDDTKVTGTGTGSVAVYSVSVSGTEDESISAETNEITTVAISGGNFSSAVPEAYCAENYTPTDADESTGLYTVTKTKEYFYGANLLLDGTIGVNFYVDLNGIEDPENYTMSFTVGGVAATDASNVTSYEEGNAITSGGATYQRYTVYVSSVQMADEIVATLNYKGTEFDSCTYSVQSYCERMIKKESTGDEMKNLCIALLNYGGYSQTNFGKTSNGLANENLSSIVTSWSDPVSSWTDEKTTALKDYESTVTGSVTGITLYGAQLNLGSETTIRVYINCSSEVEISSVSFTVGEKTLVPTSISGSEYYNYYVEFDVPSNKLSTMYTLTVSCDTEECTKTYSALTYAYNKLNDETSTENLKNVVKALYYYSVAADAYFN
ncbi:MAG: hypothetical protein LUF29_08845 [Oscillospiraceae bacterium]|nr:hypothetical protein [Oscillospiraceae bacterium]